MSRNLSDGETVPERPEATDSSTRTRRRGWSCVCLWMLTWTGPDTQGGPRLFRGPPIWTPSTLIRSVRRFESLNGANEVAQNSSYREWPPGVRMNSFRGPEDNQQDPGMVAASPHAQPDVSKMAPQTPAGYRKTAGEVNARPGSYWVTTPTLPELRNSYRVGEQSVGSGGGHRAVEGHN